MRTGLWLCILAAACGSEEKISFDNAHPVALITSHGTGDAVREGSLVTFRGSVSDESDPAEDLSTTIGEDD